MKNTHTQIIFSLKYEPLLSMIENEFSNYKYTIKHTPNGKYKTVQLNVNKIVKANKEDQVKIDGYAVQFEAIKYYKK